MKSHVFSSLAACALIFTLGLSATESAHAQSIDDITLNVYKEVTCGCCVGWIAHIDERGFDSTVFHPSDIYAVKEELGVLPKWQSCHTAVSKDGYLFEGHVPAKYISQFLASPPANALGLAVPGMPMGSPGMEMGARFNSYDVILMKKDGTSEVYATVKNQAEQY
ncbi:MAG: DUF411 domain-containing protein [Gammaproteobacteria bacterium]|nr:DUF411 domain-containing protein [Gammaproteobacteria bacterium]